LKKILNTLALIFTLTLLSAYAHAQKTTLQWATYFGGDTLTYSNNIVKDSSGNLYIAGLTYSDSGIATKGAYKTLGDSANGDAFLAKFSPSGNLLWATYFGGEGSDNEAGLAIDKDGNVCISGWTNSDSGIATSGAYKTKSDIGGNNAFLVKFSPSGSLLWGTYYGRNIENVEVGVVAIDSSNNIYITGTTFSMSGIVTKGAYQTLGDSINGNVFLAKFNSAGNLLWGTYYGDSDEGWSIAAYGSNIYITGETFSTYGNATSSAYQTSGGGAYLANFSSNGTLLWATYYGGQDYSNSVATDMFGNIYIAGGVDGTAPGIATSGAYQTSYGGGLSDGFLAKFNPVGNLLWGTYFGGSGDDVAGGTSFDATGNVYLAVTTSSTSGIATMGAYQTSYGGGSAEGVITKFNPNGNIIYSTYYGGNGEDQTLSITANDSSDVYIVGYTNSTYGIATSGAYQILNNGTSYEAFLAKFNVPIYTDIETSNTQSACFEIFPNPFSAQTAISYQLFTSSNVQIEILDLEGKLIAFLTDEKELSGNYTNTFNAEKYNMPAGVYFVRVCTDGQVITKKINKL